MFTAQNMNKLSWPILAHTLSIQQKKNVLGVAEKTIVFLTINSLKTSSVALILPRFCQFMSIQILGVVRKQYLDFFRDNRYLLESETV